MALAGRMVALHYDDGACPLVGRVLGREDDERVWVAWGDAAYSDEPWRGARVEWLDELAPIDGAQ